MKRFLTIAISGLSFALLASAGGRCNDDIPIRWEIRSLHQDNSTSTAITGDGQEYVDGQGGVDRAVINLCSGTGDATLLLGSSKSGPSRSISVSFVQQLSTNSNTPTWAAGVVSGNWFLNVRNIWYFGGPDHATEYDFTTHLTTLTPNSGHIRMLNPDADAAQANPGNAANDPYPNSLVRVHHCPANSIAPSAGLCAGLTTETWFVWSDPATTADGMPFGYPIAHVASLILDGRHSSQINAGEFSIPFYFVITRK